MSLASLRVKIDLLLHTARTKGRRAAARRAMEMLKDFLGGQQAQLRYPRVQWGEGVFIRGPLEIIGSGSVVIGDGCIFDWTGVPNRIHAPSPQATVEFGAGVYLNGVTIIANDSVRIGDRSVLGACTIIDSDFHGVGAHDRDAGGLIRPVVIEENVWIGTDAHILKGVRIGRDCVIGAGAVVRRSIPPGKIVIGNPAELVGDIPGAAPAAPS
jgi:acetyltransferase-like isoleucine patch superfamily enzyme